MLSQRLLICLQVVALAATIGLDLGTTLLFTGLYNIASGLGFRIPMCVQPMKTIAAVALAAPGGLDAVVRLAAFRLRMSTDVCHRTRHECSNMFCFAAVQLLQTPALRGHATMAELLPVK
jgi:putative copper export protein